jgi:hypothetical protein
MRPLLRAAIFGLTLSGVAPSKTLLRWTPQAQVIRESPDHLAKRIEIHNHLYCMRIGHSYRCMFCCRESLAVRWMAGNVCPLCGRHYDWMLAQDSEE